MAQTIFFNVMIDSGSASDPLKAKHGITGGAVLSGDASVSYDPSKFTSLNTVNSFVELVRQRMGAAAGLK